MQHVRDLGPRTSPNEPKRFSFRRLFNAQSRGFLAISPMFVMVSLAFVLAGVTATHHLSSSPAVIVDKKKRASDDLVEMKDPDEARRKGQMFAEKSPIYRLAKGSKTGRAISEAQQLPPVLPGDESSADKSGGTHVDRGRRGGGI